MEGFFKDICSKFVVKITNCTTTELVEPFQ